MPRPGSFHHRVPIVAAGDGVAFRGTAGAVQQRAASTMLSLAAPGHVKWGDYALESAEAASLDVRGDRLLVGLASVSTGATFTVMAPGLWTLLDPPAGASIDQGDGSMRVTIPTGAASVILVKGK
jgi:hypothetical protein